MAYVFWFIVLIGILIFAHEGGHFLFAKSFGVKVLTFSLGFGTPIRLGRFKLSWRRGDTEYRIAWFPVGGFVRMLGDDPTEEVPEADRPRAFCTQLPWKRFLIIFGGPLFSVLLAVPIYFFYHLVEDTARSPVVGLVVPGSPAEEAGIQPGDRLLAIGDRAVMTWEDVEEGQQDSGGAGVSLQLEREGRAFDVALQPVRELDETGLELLGERWDLGLRHSRVGNAIGVVPGSPAERAGMQSWDVLRAIDGHALVGWNEIEQRLQAASPGDRLRLTLLRGATVEVGAVSILAPVLVDIEVEVQPAAVAPSGVLLQGAGYTGLEPVDLYVQDVLEGYPAKAAGVEPGDKIVGMLGRDIRSWEQFSRIVVEHADEEIPLLLRHGSELRELRLRPKVLEETNEFKQTTRKPGVGVVYSRNLLPGERIPRPDRLLYALEMSVVQTGRAIAMNILGFVRIFEGRVSPREAIGGPIMIFDVAGKSAEKGFGTFASMMAFISVLLGLINLLPIPILDGGHIAFILIEVVRRRPVSVRARLISSYVGLVLLVSLMVFAFSNDIARYWSNITSLFS